MMYSLLPNLPSLPVVRRRQSVSKDEMDAYREMIRENIDYEGFVRERPYDVGQLDEMVEFEAKRTLKSPSKPLCAGGLLPFLPTPLPRHRDHD